MNEDSILITGANGQLGRGLRLKYPKARVSDLKELDITDPQSVSEYPWDKITTLINAAAYTNVDGAETTEGRVSAWEVNSQAVATLAQAIIQNQITFIHFSSDYVFDGSKESHDENEPYSPLSVYGSSKAAGDIVTSLVPKHYLIRTSWVIGDGKNFVRTMLGLGRQGISPMVVNDQVGRPTFSTELVRVVDYLLSNQATYGTYNVSNDGKISSWADVAEAIFKDTGLKLDVKRVSTVEYYAGKQNTAPRPLNSTLNLSKLHSTGFISRDWEEDLREYLRKEVPT